MASSSTTGFEIQTRDIRNPPPPPPPPPPNPPRGPHVRESKTLWNLDSTQWIPDFRSRGVLPENWVEMCGTLPETLTIFQTKICDFTYPISDLTFKSIP